MYALLALYARPLNKREPVICIDEKSLQLLWHSRAPVPMGPSVAAKHDYEYVRRGTVNLFVAVEPKAGQRQVSVTAQRGKSDFVAFVADLLHGTYATARRVHLVLDNLNTHFRKCFEDVLGKAAANKHLRRVQFHYTPKHASGRNWLRSRSASSAANAWIGACRAPMCLPPKWPLGSMTATPVAAPSSGALLGRMRIESSADTTFRYLRVDVLGAAQTSPGTLPLPTASYASLCPYGSPRPTYKRHRCAGRSAGARQWWPWNRVAQKSKNASSWVDLSKTPSAPSAAHSARICRVA